MMPKPALVQWASASGKARLASCINRSAQPTGPGLAASKYRKRTNASVCASNPAGITNHSTSQNAVISSHTMWPGSRTPICLAVTVHAHQPTGIEIAITQPHCHSFNHCDNTKNETHAHKVPAVPGANGDSPDPNPRASQCAGCASMRRTVGRTVPVVDAVAMAVLPCCTSL